METVEQEQKKEEQEEQQEQQEQQEREQEREQEQEQEQEQETHRRHELAGLPKAVHGKGDVRDEEVALACGQTGQGCLLLLFGAVGKSRLD